MRTRCLLTLLCLFSACVFNSSTFAADYHGKKGVWLNFGAHCARLDNNGNIVAESRLDPKTYESAEESADAVCDFTVSDPVCNPYGNMVINQSGNYVDNLDFLGITLKDAYRFSCQDNDIFRFSVFLGEKPEDKCKKTVGDPIDVSNGLSVQTVTDVSDIGYGGLDFTRYYLDSTNNALFTETFATANGRWSHGFARPLAVTGDFVFVIRPEGVRYLFNKVGNDWQTYDGTLASGYHLLETIDTGFQLWTPEGGVEYYSNDGLLLRQIDSHGLQTDYAYNPSGLLETVSSPTGKHLTLAYEKAQMFLTQLASVTDQSGRSWRYQYEYDANTYRNKLVSVVYPDATPDDDTDNPHTQYLYEDPNFPGNLTGIIDENGNHHVSWTYDEQGRVIANQLAEGATRVELSFGPGDSTSVTDALGATRVYDFQNVQGVMKNTGVSQPGGSGCSAASNSIGYDANGNVSARTDFNGHTTTYSYDLSRNLETQRVEAAGQAEARTISTNWHPYWRLPVGSAEPNKITYWSYNGDNGQYCAPQTATVPRPAVRGFGLTATTHTGAGSQRTGRVPMWPISPNTAITPWTMPISTNAVMSPPSPMPWDIKPVSPVTAPTANPRKSSTRTA